MTEYAHKAHERLSRLKEARLEVKICCDRIQELDNLAQCCGSVNITDKVQTSKPEGSKMESVIIDLIAEQDKLKRLVNELIDLENELVGDLEELDPVQREILKLRYSRGLKDATIAREVGYSLDHTRRLRRKALEIIGEKQDDDER